MQTELGIPKTVAKKVAGELMKILSDTYILYLKTQNFHWNIVSPEFFSLHLLFEKQYETLAEAIDEIAERIRSLGFFVNGSFRFFLENGSLKEEEKILSDKKMLETLVKDHEKMSKNGHRFIIDSQEAGDNVSADMIIEKVTFHEKAAWMLRSHLPGKKTR